MHHSKPQPWAASYPDTLHTLLQPRLDGCSTSSLLLLLLSAAVAEGRVDSSLLFSLQAAAKSRTPTDRMPIYVPHWPASSSRSSNRIISVGSREMACLRQEGAWKVQESQEPGPAYLVSTHLLHRTAAIFFFLFFKIKKETKIILWLQ